LEQRILLYMSTSKDADMTAGVLQRAGIDSAVCDELDELEIELARGAGALMLAEETLTSSTLERLAQLLSQQPAWSDIPVVVLALKGVDSRVIGDVMGQIPNVAVIERPVRVASFVSAVRSTLRAREHQYQVRSLIEQLQQSDQRKTEFLATLAHELRNPLAPIRTALDLLSHTTPDAQAVHRYQAVIQRQVDHLVHLVDELMDMSRISQGKISLHSERVAIDEVLDEAIEQSRPLVEAAGHELVVERSAEPLFVIGDRTRLTQVFCNLLNNAAKFSPTPASVHVMSRRDAATGQAWVSVSDRGVGVPTHMLHAIFDMFVQAGDTARPAQGGLGIGLTLVKSLVELHGGSIEATSPGPGQGATFTVRLPLAASVGDAKAEQPRADATPEAHAARRVLVVDDNRDAADSLNELLKMHGMQSAVAYSAEDALRLVSGQDFDAALLDIGLPGMDGCELAERLKASPAHARLKLIAITGWGQHDDRRRLAAAGFDHHLLKPVNSADLMRLL
jgi:signal transduction histidine kinase/CheY-like chemotaxis protein